MQQQTVIQRGGEHHEKCGISPNFPNIRPVEWEADDSEEDICLPRVSCVCARCSDFGQVMGRVIVNHI